MAQFNIADFLPMFPWEGPPLPRFLGIRWPSLRREESFPLLPMPPDYISEIVTSKPVTTYENIEEWELQRGENGRIDKVIIHRRVIENE